MAIDQSDELFCEVSFLLDSCHDGSASYSGDAGLARTLVLRGFIEDLDYGPIGDGPGSPGSVAHSKKVRIEVRSPVDEDFLSRVIENRLPPAPAPPAIIGSGGVANGGSVDFSRASVCGLASFRANLGANTYSALGQEVVDDVPVEVYLCVSDDAFDNLRSQSMEAYRRLQILSCKLRLIGNALKDKPDRTPFLGLKLRDLDLTKDQVYAVEHFEIATTILIDHYRGRFRPVPSGEGEALGVGLGVRITDVRYEIYSAYPGAISLTCDGSVIRAHGTPYHGASVTVHFLPHDDGGVGSPIDRAPFGDFTYHPPSGEAGSQSSHWSLCLRYFQPDIRDLLQELVGKRSSGVVDLSVNLLTDAKALEGSQQVSGSIRNYSVAASYAHLSSDANILATSADLRGIMSIADELRAEMVSRRESEELLSSWQRPATAGAVEAVLAAVTPSNGRNPVNDLLAAQERSNRLVKAVLWLSGISLVVSAAALIFG